MELLKNKDEFEAWRSGNIFDGDTADTPKEFPCFVDTNVQSWNYEEVRAVYYYRSTLQGMLDQLNA